MRLAAGLRPNPLGSLQRPRRKGKGGKMNPKILRMLLSPAKPTRFRKKVNFTLVPINRLLALWWLIVTVNLSKKKIRHWALYALILEEHLTPSIEAVFFTPPPVGGRGIVFERFVCLFISSSATLRENGWTDLHEIFREGVEWPYGTTWLNFGSIRVNGSADRGQFVITGHSYLVCLWPSGRPVVPPSDWECNEIAACGLSLSRSTGAGFVVPRTTACSDNGVISCHIVKYSNHHSIYTTATRWLLQRTVRPTFSFISGS